MQRRRHASGPGRGYEMAPDAERTVFSGVANSRSASPARIVATANRPVASTRTELAPARCR